MEKTSELSRLGVLLIGPVHGSALLRQPRDEGPFPEAWAECKLPFSEGSEPLALERLSADVRMSSAGC